MAVGQYFSLGLGFQLLHQLDVVAVYDEGDDKLPKLQHSDHDTLAGSIEELHRLRDVNADQRASTTSSWAEIQIRDVFLSRKSAMRN